ncbi:hypothetical protein Vi05172_g4327 [Venturia inaequalis]|nr:hypothetical protein Vi05172_g4327 [Venturia inaequalis]
MAVSAIGVITVNACIRYEAHDGQFLQRASTYQTFSIPGVHDAKPNLGSNLRDPKAQSEGKIPPATCTPFAIIVVQVPFVQQFSQVFVVCLPVRRFQE